ncbi:serine hydroxymethyltransferase [Buchnera aphidicola (Shivaphis celti)]
MKYKTLNLNTDKKIWNYIQQEMKRQEEHIELIASENYASFSVMQAQGSQLTNKYAEGYPGKRYYGGCSIVDKIEKLAIERAKKLFQADYANVQPHSGSQANFAVYAALLHAGDTILGMNLSHGGHLTHGSKVNFSGKLYNTVSYGVNENGKIDYNEIEYLAKKYKPKMIVGGFSAYSQHINWKIMRDIADTVNSYLLIDMAHVAGLVAAKLYPNPIEYADVVTTTTHKTLAGPRGGLILSKNKSEKFYKKLNSAIFPGTQGGPLMHIIAAKAISFQEALDPEFKIYQQQILKNANSMVNVFLENNFHIVSGGTQNHLFLIDLRNKNITGKKTESVLELANITVNKNSVPNDLNNPFVTSGIRIGTPAITRRGLTETESIVVANWIIELIKNYDSCKKILHIKNQVLNLCKKYPVYK